jgi:hypothetical protein
VLSPVSSLLPALGASSLLPSCLYYVISPDGRSPDAAATAAALEGVFRAAGLLGLPARAHVVDLREAPDEEGARAGLRAAYERALLPGGDLEADFEVTAGAEAPGKVETKEFSGLLLSAAREARAERARADESVKAALPPDPEEEEEGDEEGGERRREAERELSGRALSLAADLSVSLSALSEPPAACRDFGAAASSLFAAALASLDSLAGASQAAGVPARRAFAARAALAAELSRLARVALAGQLALLAEEEFEAFRADLNTLKVSPNLPADVAGCVKAAAKSYAEAAGKLEPAAAGLVLEKSVAAGAARKFRERTSSFAAERLLAAEASGSFQPVPRKPVTFGFHWLLPKPFAGSTADFRQARAQDPDNVIYTPKSKRSEVSREDVLKGRDWRAAVTSQPEGGSGLTFSP